MARRRRFRGLIIAALTLVLAGGALIAAEAVLRGVVQDRVRGIVADALDLPETQRIDVAVGGIVIPQLIAGRLDDVAIDAPDLAVAGLTGDASVRLHGVPARGDDTSALGGDARIGLDAGDVETLLAAASGSWGELVDVEIALPGPEAVLSGGFSVFGQTVPLELDAVPSLDGGDVVVTPEAFRVGGLELTADDLAQAPVDLSGISAPVTVCRGDALPAGISVASVGIRAEHLAVELRLDDGFVDDPAAPLEGGCA